MKLSTESLNDALGFVKNGLSANSYIQLAGTISLIIKDGELFAVTEPDDGEVKYMVSLGKVSGEDTAVAVDGFQLIQATSVCKDTQVELEILEDKISLNNGRGALYLPLLVNDDNKPVSNTLSPVAGDLVEVKDVDTLKLLTSCLATTMDNLAVRNIYCNTGISIASDLVNIAKGNEVIGTELLVSTRMREFLLRYPDCKFMSSETSYTLVAGNKVAVFSKETQSYIQEFPVDALKAEFKQEKIHSFTVDMGAFLNALSFLRVTTNSVNDYSVTLRASGPNSIELISDHGSKQVLTVDWLSKESEEWTVQFDCVSALSRFSFADGIRRIDIYNSQIAVVGPVEVSLGLIEDA